MKIDGFLNDSDENQIKEYVEELLKNPSKEEIASGGIMVRYEDTNKDGSKYFEVHRLIATIIIPKEKR